MRIDNREFICGCCGERFVSKQTLSYRMINPQLDGRPTGVEIPTGLTECPRCHYVNTKIEKKVNDEERAIIGSAEYQDLMSGGDSSAIYKAALILKKDPSVRITILRRYVWHLSDQFGIHAEETKTVRSQYISELNAYIQEEPSIEDLMLYVDALRVNEEFDQLSKVLEEVLQGITQTGIQRDSREYQRFVSFVRFEAELLARKDCEIHYRSEVDH